jgi:hypothetical protein
MIANIQTWSAKKPFVARSTAFLARPAFAPEAEAAAAALLADIRARGGRRRALRPPTFDGASLKASELRVSAEALGAAARAVPARVK